MYNIAGRWCLGLRCQGKWRDVLAAMTTEEAGTVAGRPRQVVHRHHNKTPHTDNTASPLNAVLDPVLLYITCNGWDIV